MPTTGQLTIVLAVFFSMAGFVWLMRRHFSRRFDVPVSRFRWISLGLALFGIAFAAGASFVLREVAAPVVLRARLDGTAGLREGTPAVLRSVRFYVARPGREHRLTVRLVPAKGIEPRGPVRMELSLLGPDESALVDTNLVLPVGSRNFGFSARPAWEIGSVAFRPRAPGRHVLRLTPMHAGIQRLEVKIVD